MAKNTKTNQKKSVHILREVKAGFILKGTSLNAYCYENNIDQGNASRALNGTWAGKKGMELKNKLINASKIQP